MSETTNTPNLPDPKKADAATPDHSTTENLSTTPATSATAAPAATAAAPAKPTSRKRKALVAGGSVLAALLLAGGGIAVGAAVADENDDDRDEASATSVSAQDDADDADDRSDVDSVGGTANADRGTTSADELNEIVEAAASEADGTAVSVDANADGSWDVEFRTDAGDETEVRVASDGTAKVVSTEAADADDADDTAPQGTLDAKTLDALVAAALGEVDGRIVDLEVDDDTTSPYDVSVLTGEGSTVEVSLDADLKVTASGTDD